MIPRLVPEISPLDAFCDVVGVVVGVGVLGVGIGDCRSWMGAPPKQKLKNYFRALPELAVPLTPHPHPIKIYPQNMYFSLNIYILLQLSRCERPLPDKNMNLSAI